MAAEQQINEQCKRALIAARDAIRQGISELNDITTYLYSNFVIDDLQLQHITSGNLVLFEQIDRLLAIVQGGSQRRFEEFIKSLFYTNRPYIVTAINDRLQEYGHDIVDIAKMRAYINESKRTFSEKQLQYIKAPNNTSTRASGTTVSPGVTTIPPVPPPAYHEFNALLEVNKIIDKFEKLTAEEKVALRRVLPSALIKELNDRRDLFADVILEDLVNLHMSAVLPDGTIKKIRKANDNSNGAYEMCESLRRSSILALLIFLKGLKSTNQDHLFGHFSEAFCNELKVILGCEQTDSTASNRTQAPGGSEPVPNPSPRPTSQNQQNDNEDEGKERLYLSNIFNDGSSERVQGKRMIQYIDGLSCRVKRDLELWINNQRNNLNALSLSKEGIPNEYKEKIEEYSEQQIPREKYYCCIGILNRHAYVYFIPLNGLKRKYEKGNWIEIKESCNVLKCHLRYSVVDKENFGVHIKESTLQFEKKPLYFALIVNAHKNTLVMAAALTGVLMRDYQQLKSDCLVYAKTVLKLLADGLNHNLNERKFDTLSVTFSFTEAWMRSYLPAALCPLFLLVLRNPVYSMLILAAPFAFHYFRYF